VTISSSGPLLLGADARAGCVLVDQLGHRTLVPRQEASAHETQSHLAQRGDLDHLAQLAGEPGGQVGAGHRGELHRAVAVVAEDLVGLGRLHHDVGQGRREMLVVQRVAPPAGAQQHGHRRRAAQPVAIPRARTQPVGQGPLQLGGSRILRTLADLVQAGQQLLLLTGKRRHARDLLGMPAEIGKHRRAPPRGELAVDEGMELVLLDLRCVHCRLR
jgi:hypothetical protein